MRRNWKRDYAALSGQMEIMQRRLLDYEVALANADAQRPKIVHAFALGQRVTVPDSGGVQGMVVAASAGVGMENSYIVAAMTDEGRSGSVSYGEAVLTAAQK